MLQMQQHKRTEIKKGKENDGCDLICFILRDRVWKENNVQKIKSCVCVVLVLFLSIVIKKRWKNKSSQIKIIKKNYQLINLASTHFLTDVSLSFCLNFLRCCSPFDWFCSGLNHSKEPIVYTNILITHTDCFWWFMNAVQ